MHQNKWGYWGYNCKGWAEGSGTTHANRRAQREHKQWGHMAEEEPDPSSEECLEKHLENLRKAAEKAEKKLEEAREKKSLEKDDSRDPSSSSSFSVSRASGAKRKPLEKGMEVRRTRRGKNGETEQLLEVKEEPLEKDPPKSLKKDKPSKSLNKDDKSKPLEKGKSSQPVKMEEDQGKSLGKDKGQDKSLEKDKGQDKSLEKDKGQDKSLEKDKPSKSLEKDLASSSSVEREGLRLKPAPPKPVVVVDWHETLEIGGRVPEENEAALEKLLEVAEVHILSYVESTSRQRKLHQDVQDLRCFAQLAGVHTCWGRWGKDGKADWCEHLGASAIFDNHGGVIDECLTFKKHLHLLCFAIQTEKQSHKKLQQSLVFQTFAKAVEQYLEI